MVMDSIKKWIKLDLVFTLPIMSVITLFGSLKFNAALSDIFIFLFLAIGVINFKSLKNIILFPYWWYFSGLIGLTLISAVLAMKHPGIHTASFGFLVGEIIKFLVSAAYLLVGFHFLSNKLNTTKNFFQCWIYSTILVVAIGIFVQVSMLFGHTIEFNELVSGNRNRFLGTLTDSNLAALYLSFSFFISLGFSRMATEKKSVILGQIGMYSSVIGIFLTLSRGGLIGFITGITFYALLNIKKLYKFIYFFPSILLIFILILNVDAYVFKSNIFTSFTTRIELAANREDMFKARLNTSLAALKMGRDHFFFGVGRGNFRANSKEYLIEQGVDWDKEGKFYGKLIPHNTLAGFFAEMGIFGLLMFCSIFVILFIKLYKAENIDKDIKKVIFALIVAVFVQSIPLNIENFRGLWLFTGLLLSICDKNVLMVKNSDVGIKENKRPFMALFASIILLLVSTVLFFNAARNIRQPEDITGKSLNLSYTVPEEGKYIFRYFIDTVSDSQENPSLLIDIYGYDGKNEKHLQSISYWKAKGYGNLDFNVSAAVKKIQIRISSDKVEEGAIRIFDTKLILPDQRIVPVMDDFPLLNQALFSFMKNRFLLVDNESKLKVKESRKYFTNGMLETGQWESLSDKVSYKGVSIEKLNGNKVKFNFHFTCLSTMEFDYVLWMHLQVDDINTIPVNSRHTGYINRDHNLELPTSQWKLGKEYVHSYITDLQPGEYMLDFGFWVSPSRSVDKKEHRLFTKDGKHGIVAGWFKID